MAAKENTQKNLNALCIENMLTPSALSVCRGKIEVFKTIDSTNTEAKRRLNSCSDSSFFHGSVLLAEHQSAGRGRLGKSFFSPAESGIYMSLIYMPKYNLKEKNKNSFTASGDNSFFSSDTSLLTAFAAVCVCRALDTIGIEGKIKWVNDIFVNEKKVCGILTEGFIREREIDAVIAGVGINVYKAQEGFPEELKNTAASLSENCIAGGYIDRNALAASIISCLLDAFSRKSDSRLLIEEYKKRSFILGKTVTVISPLHSYKARVLKITDDAHLVVEDSAGKQRELLSGEISLRL